MLAWMKPLSHGSDAPPKDFSPQNNGVEMVVLYNSTAMGSYRAVYLLHGVHPHPRPIDLDLVCVHGGVGDQDLGVLYALRLPHANLLVQDEAFIQERVLDGKRTGISHDASQAAGFSSQAQARVPHYPIANEPLQHHVGGKRPTTLYC